MVEVRRLSHWATREAPRRLFKLAGQRNPADALPASPSLLAGGPLSKPASCRPLPRKMLLRPSAVGGEGGHPKSTRSVTRRGSGAIKPGEGGRATERSLLEMREGVSQLGCLERS